jgi:hypothetical protein
MQVDTYIGDRLSYLVGSLLGIDQATQAQALLEACGTQVAHFFFFKSKDVHMSLRPVSDEAGGARCRSTDNASLRKPLT